MTIVNWTLLVLFAKILPCCGGATNVDGKIADYNSGLTKRDGL
jgi:hypothetical protein